MRALYKRVICAAAVVAGIALSSLGWGRVSRRNIEQELAPLLEGGESEHALFSMEHCPIPVADITRFVLMGAPSTHELRFAPGCDLDGDLPLDSRPAMIDVRVRHLGRIKRIRGLLSSEPGDVPGASFGVITRLDDGELILEGHGLPVNVTAEYEVGFPGVLSMTHPTTVGGRLHVTNFDGEPVHFVAPLAVESRRVSGLQSPHAGASGDPLNCGNVPDCYGKVRAR